MTWERGQKNQRLQFRIFENLNFTGKSAGGYNRIRNKVDTASFGQHKFWGFTESIAVSSEGSFIKYVVGIFSFFWPLSHVTARHSTPTPPYLRDVMYYRDDC